MEEAVRPMPDSLRSRVRHSRRSSGLRSWGPPGVKSHGSSALNLGLTRRSLPDFSITQIGSPAARASGAPARELVLESFGGGGASRFKSLAKAERPRQSGGLVEAQGRVALLEHAPAAQGPERLDRKSTRLNSSHE